MCIANHPETQWLLTTLRLPLPADWAQLGSFCSCRVDCCLGLGWTGHSRWLPLLRDRGCRLWARSSAGPVKWNIYMWPLWSLGFSQHGTQDPGVVSCECAPRSPDKMLKTFYKLASAIPECHFCPILIAFLPGRIQPQTFTWPTPRKSQFKVSPPQNILKEGRIDLCIQ